MSPVPPYDDRDGFIWMDGAMAPWRDVKVHVLTHGLHMLFGLLWMAVMVVQVLRQGFTEGVVYRLLNLRIFWHFQALIWVFIFTFVYLQGKL